MELNGGVDSQSWHQNILCAHAGAVVHLLRDVVALLASEEQATGTKDKPALDQEVKRCDPADNTDNWMVPERAIRSMDSVARLT